MKIRRAVVLVLAVALLVGLRGATFAAARTEAREETALQGAKLTLSQAISVAERRTGGKAFDAGVNVDSGKPYIVVETNGPKGVQTVIIDAQSGQIVGGHAGGKPD
jgi:uncharacterized membrane protein YkoI